MITDTLREEYGLPGRDQILTFSSTDGDFELMLPDRRYLAIHAAACRIGHLSGTIGFYLAIESVLEEKGLHPLGLDSDSPGDVSLAELWQVS